MRKTSFRAASLALAFILVLAGAAYAYWTVSGTGAGQASTGTVVGITVNQTPTITGLAPGLPAQALLGTFDNPNAGPVYVGSVTATVTGTSNVGCDATNYTITGTATVNAEVIPGSGVGAWSGLNIAFNNKPTINQNACKGVTVNIAYTSN